MWMLRRKIADPDPAPRRPIPSSDLWDLVMDMDWTRVIEHAQQHPHDAAYVDGHYDESVLYLCCQHNPPLEVVQAIRRAFPQAATTRSREHRDLPLHIACQYQLSVEILEELLHDFPETAMDHTRIDQTPIMILWKARCRQLTREQQVRERQQQGERQGQEEAVNGEEVDTPPPLVTRQNDEELWRKIMVLLKAVAMFKRDEAANQRSPSLLPSEIPDSSFHENISTTVEDELLLVHAAVSLGSRSCPFPVLERVLAQFPVQIQQRDEQGMLPLHIAVSPCPLQTTNRRQYLPREKQVIEALLETYPQSARLPIRETLPTEASSVDLERYRFPLMMALSNRHTWSGGVEALVQAAPDVLLTRDPVTKLYPFQLAATSTGTAGMSTECLDLTYRLLRAQPQVLNLMDPASSPQLHVTNVTDTSSNNEARTLFIERFVCTAVVAILVGLAAQVLVAAK